MLFLSEGLYNKVAINPFGGEFNLEAESSAILCKLQIIQNLPQCSNMSNKRERPAERGNICETFLTLYNVHPNLWPKFKTGYDSIYNNDENHNMEGKKKSGKYYHTRTRKLRWFTIIMSCY